MASLASRLGARFQTAAPRVSPVKHTLETKESQRGLKQAAKLKLKAQRSLVSSYSFTHRGQRYSLAKSTTRQYHSSRSVLNSEAKTEEQEQTETKKERKQEGPAYAPQGPLVKPDWPPFGKYPYAWIGLTIASLGMFGYTWFIFREEKMIERYEFMNWGGEMDRIHSLKKIRKYLYFDTFGIMASEKMSDFGLCDTAMKCLLDPSPEVRDLALEVVCGFSSNDRLHKHMLEELGALDFLRRFAAQGNLYMWQAVSNLAQGNHEICKEIANDEYFMENLLAMYETALRSQDVYFLRPVVRLLAQMAYYKDCAEVMSGPQYQPKLDLLLGAMIIPEGQSHNNNINLRYRLVLQCPEKWPNWVENWPQLALEIAEIGAASSNAEDPVLGATSSINMYQYIHQALVVGVAGAAWSAFRAWRLRGKFDPLSRSERQWIRNAVWKSPITAIALSFVLNGVEQLSAFVSKDVLSWDGFRDARYAYAPYFLVLPIYWAALNYLGPFATIPSLIRVRYRENLPPITYRLRKHLLAALVEIGWIDNAQVHPQEHQRLTTNINEVHYNNQKARESIKKDAEWFMAKEKRKKWFGMF